MPTGTGGEDSPSEEGDSRRKGGLFRGASRRKKSRRKRNGIRRLRSVGGGAHPRGRGYKGYCLTIEFVRIKAVQRTAFSFYLETMVYIFIVFFGQTVQNEKRHF